MVENLDPIVEKCNAVIIKTGAVIISVVENNDPESAKEILEDIQKTLQEVLELLGSKAKRKDTRKAFSSMIV